MFNALASLDVLRDAAVLDLFAGSGALGIEALSRGASRCTFVETSGPALRALRANLAALDLDERAEVVPADGLRYVARAGTTFDLALVDPPYTFDRWSDLLDMLDADLVVAEAGHPVDASPGWLTVRERAYGGTVVTFLRPAG
jgi:16S rRNA (guanine966-N2)-methyltransferase